MFHHYKIATNLQVLLTQDCTVRGTIAEFFSYKILWKIPHLSAKLDLRSWNNPITTTCIDFKKMPFHHQMSISDSDSIRYKPWRNNYRGSLPKATFGSGKKVALAKFRTSKIFGWCVFWAKLFHYCDFFSILSQL